MNPATPHHGHPATPIRALTRVAVDTEGTDLMRRRTLIASALGIAAAHLPAWAHGAAATTDRDATALAADWNQAHTEIGRQLHAVAEYYMTENGKRHHKEVCDTALWVFAQAHRATLGAPASGRQDANRLAAQAAFTVAGCYVDYGDVRAAAGLFGRATQYCGDGDTDLRAFIAAQTDWLHLYASDHTTVLRRTDGIIPMAERSGGFGLLMGYTHRANACANLGAGTAAREALKELPRVLDRLPQARAPQTTLNYTESKAWFSAALTYARLGDVAMFEECAARATDDPHFSWMDRELLKIASGATSRDPEESAHRILGTLKAVPQEAYSHCIKADAEAALRRIKLTYFRQSSPVGSQTSELAHFLASAKVA